MFYHHAVIGLKPRRSKSFKKDLKLMIRRGKDVSKLRDVAQMLSERKILPEKYQDHGLQGKFIGCRDCHIEPDWLLIYRILEDEIIFERTGTHSDLFKK